jgi:preprotein translocase subunit SecE
VARETRSTKSQKRDAGTPAEKSTSSRASERRKRVKPVAETKAQTGAKREPRGFGRFVRECIGELKKVEWPGQRQLFSATVVVIIAVAVVGFYLWVLDEAFSRLVKDVLLNF